VDVLAVASADEAILQLAQMNRVPSLLMVDAQLPSEPALQAVARVSDEFNTDFPLILCSDEPLLATPDTGGATRSCVLTRPFSAERLRDAINQCLSSLG
jgi:CheY-like chemotaxis protein